LPVVVNRTLIPDADINQESAHVDSGSILERHEEAARRLVVRELLQQRAKQIGIDTGTEPNAVIDRLLEWEVRIPEVDETACRRYFESNRDRFRSPVTVEIRHILLKAAPDDPEQRAAGEQQADALIAELRAAPDRFEELAERHSACLSGAEGGHLGAVGRGQTVPEFEDVVLRLEPGLAGRPVETRYGFHVVEVLGRQGGKPLDFDGVRRMIADYLQERSWRRAVHQYIQVLISDAEIQGVDFPETATPLIQ